MSNKTVEALAWVLIYGGLIIASLGVFLRHDEGLLGSGVFVTGLLLAVGGGVLIWLRSRMKDDPDEP